VPASIFESSVPNGRHEDGTIDYSSNNGQAVTVDVLIAKAANACRPDRDLGSTAQMMASLFNRTRQVDMLLAAGANRSIQDAAGRSASSVAADQGNAPMAARVKH